MNIQIKKSAKWNQSLPKRNSQKMKSIRSIYMNKTLYKHKKVFKKIKNEINMQD